MQEWDGGGRGGGVAEKLQYNNNIDIVDSREQSESDNADNGIHLEKISVHKFCITYSS